MEGGNGTRKGLVYGLVTYFIWGFLPLFWKELAAIDPWSLLVYRIGWSFVVMTVVSLYYFKWQGLKEQFCLLLFKKESINILLAAGSIGLNWGAFIYCVSSNQTTQASFAYFCSPLFTVFFGWFLFHEQLNRWQKIGIVCLIGSLVVKIVSGEQVSTIALVMSFAVAGYGVLEKKGAGHPIFRMWVETIILLPIVVIIQQKNGLALIVDSSSEIILLCLSGVATALPLVLFMEATKRLPQTTLAILQYINPLVMLLLSVFLFQEVLYRSDIWSFCWILAGSVLFTIGLQKNNYLEEENDKRRDANDSISTY